MSQNATVIQMVITEPHIFSLGCRLCVPGKLAAKTKKKKQKLPGEVDDSRKKKDMERVHTYQANHQK